MSEQTYKVKSAEVTKTDVGQYGNNIITATIENGDGKTAEVELMQKPSTPVPAAGETLTGTVEKTQYGLRFRKASKFNGNGSGYSKDREDSIDRAVAIKSATQLVSARIMAGELKGEEAAQAALEAMTVDIIALVKGDQKKAEGKAPEAKKPADPDSDIPF